MNVYVYYKPKCRSGLGLTRASGRSGAERTKDSLSGIFYQIPEYASTKLVQELTSDLGGTPLSCLAAMEPSTK